MRNTAVEHEVTSSWGLSLSTEVLQNEDELTELFLSKARDLTQCEYSSLYWVRKRELEAAGRTGDKGGQRLRMAIADEKILGHVAVTREPVIVTDAYNDARFDPTIDSQTGYRTETVLCMPVVDGDADAIIAVAQMVNKKGGAIFTADDAGRFQALAKQCVVALKACRSYTKVAQRYHNYKAIFDALTQLATTDAADATATNDVLTEGAKTLMSCERASLFVADSERHLLYSKLAQKSHGKQMSSSLNLGLATEVVKTGTLLNVPDAYRDKRFGRDIDGGQRSRTKAILAMPVMYRDEPIGVIQVINKHNGEPFNKTDEWKLAMYTYFICDVLEKRRMYNFMMAANVNAMQVVRAVLQRQFPGPKRVAVRAEEAGLVRRCMEMMLSEKEKETAESAAFNSLQYKNASLDSNKSLTLVRVLMNLFVDLGVVEALDVDLEVLARFLLRARGLYRQISYHNFLHACELTQSLFLLLQRAEVDDLLTATDVLVLLLAGVGYHVGHSGLNSSFHFQCHAYMDDMKCIPAASITIQLDHTALLLQILGCPDSNPLSCLDEEAQDRALASLVSLTLLTSGDCSRLQAHLDEGASPMPKALLLQTLLSTALLAKAAKPFEVAQAWAFHRSEEFFCKGDMVKEWYEEDNVADISAMAAGQAEFLEAVVIPHLETVVRFEPAWADLLENARDNYNLWLQVMEEQGKNEEWLEPVPKKFRSHSRS